MSETSPLVRVIEFTAAAAIVGYALFSRAHPHRGVGTRHVVSRDGESVGPTPKGATNVNLGVKAAGFVKAKQTARKITDKGKVRVTDPLNPGKTRMVRPLAASGPSGTGKRVNRNPGDDCTSD